MDKLSSITDHANDLQHELDTVGNVLPSWANTRELQITAKRAKLAPETAVAGCVDLTQVSTGLERVEALIHSVAGPADTRAV